MPPCNCHPPFPRPEPFSPLPRPGHVPDWGKWIRGRLSEKGALLAFPTRALFPGAGEWPNLYLDLETGAIYRWDRTDYAVLVDPREGNDVLVYDSVAAFPDEGEQGKLYVAANTGSLYRWGGEGYVALLPGKADKVVPQTAGNFAALDAEGNLVDSTKKPSDYEFESGPSGKVSDPWTCTPATTQYGTPFSVKWITDPTEGEGWALFTGDTKQGKVLGDAGSTELSWSPGAGTAFYDVTAVRQFSGTEYHLKGQPDAKLQPAGDYASGRKVAAMEDKIPPQASASNQLADKAFVNSSVATNAATFRGTFNLVTDLQLPLDATHVQVAQAIRAALVAAGVDPDDHDYAFVQIPQDLEHTDAMKQVDRYKCTVVSSSQTWAYEWTLNNSSFTAAQWAAINSGITSGAVAKLGALPTAEALAQVLAGKASIADATLTPIYSQTPAFSEWVVRGDFSADYWMRLDGDGWNIYVTNEAYPEGLKVTSAGKGDALSTSLSWTRQEAAESFTATRTRTDILGYHLGSQEDKPLASKAEVEALRTELADKLDKTAVVPPSTSSLDSGKAADAKATGDALAARPTKSQLNEGWWSDWTIKRDGVDVTAQVSTPPEFEDGEETGWYVANSHISTDYEQVLFITGTENDTSLSWTADSSEYNTVYYTATRHRVAAPVPTKPEDIGAAPLASPAFTGTPTAPTPSSGDSSTKVATTAFVQGALDMLTVIDDQLVPLDGPGSSTVSTFGNSYLAGHFSDWSSVGAGSLAYTARNATAQDWAYPPELFTDRFVFAAKAPLTGGYGAFRRSLVFPFSGVYRVSIEYTPIKQGATPLQLPVVVGLSCNGGEPVWNNVGQCEYGRLHSAYALVSAKAGAGFIDVMAKESRERNGFAFSRLKVELVDKAGVEVSEIADNLTAGGDSPVKSSGIWSAIWGALTALPTGFASLYDWCVAQLADKADRAANPTSGNLAALDASGNPTDSGKKPADFATATQGQKADDSVQRTLDNANPSAKTAVTIGTRSTENAADRGQASLAVGDHPKASGKNAVATGTWTQATAKDSHAEGNLSQATNYGAHAEGNNTQATGPYSHTEGSDTAAPGLVAHAEGNYTTAGGTGAHTEGMFTKASGPGAHAEGSNLDRLADLLQAAGASAEIVALFRQAATDAAGSFSHTEGLVSATSEMGSHAQGFRAGDGGNPFSFVWQGYSGAVPTAAQMQALLNDPTSQDAQAALQCLATALTTRGAYTSKGSGTFCINPVPQGVSTDPKSGFFIGDESLDKALRYSFHTASQSTPQGFWNITEVPSGVDRADIDIYRDSDYEDWCIINYSTGDTDFIGRHDENDKSPISYNGYVADWVVTQRIDNLADRAINSATLGSTVTAATVTLPAAVSGRSRDFYIDLTIEAVDAPTLTFIDPATSTTATIAFGAESLADIAPGYNLVLWTELPNNRWLVSVRHEEAS